MVEVKSFVELSSRKEKFEPSKPKEMSNGREDHEEEHDEEDNNNNSTNNVRDCPKKFVFSTIDLDDEVDRASMRLGLIVRSVEAKSVLKMKEALSFRQAKLVRMNDSRLDPAQNWITIRDKPAVYFWKPNRPLRTQEPKFG
ncbi:hypothetical protein J1N35_011079 [Gossypium stocksii]|uniref:Uncharacterized protein n=1 Tax=Gossypium stocksii TaxID=47602 RepID=A0A9D4ADC1_9ROSI|nr:hypothetical protein J1N35_011079 [Gossypium stocksii]